MPMQICLAKTKAFNYYQKHTDVNFRCAMSAMCPPFYLPPSHLSIMKCMITVSIASKVCILLDKQLRCVSLSLKSFIFLGSDLRRAIVHFHKCKLCSMQAYLL